VAFVGEDELNEPPRYHRWPYARATQVSDLPHVVESATALQHLRAAQVAPSAPSALGSDPGDLVARALAILADEAEAWRNRRNANILFRSVQ
jgi:hypothetical protein